MHLNLFVSQQCFCLCKGCYSFSREEKCDQFVPTEKLVDFLNFAYAEGVRKVTLCGGDPLTRIDIIDLLEKIKDIGFSISVDTLGTSVIKNIEKNGQIVIKKIDVKKFVKLVDMIGIPIDGSTNQIFKLFRQIKTDIVKNQLDICKELNKFGANICINTVVHKGNLEDSRNLAKLIKKISYINKWQVFQFLPYGRFGSLNRNIFEITEQDFLEFKSAVLDELGDESYKVQFKDACVRDNAYMLVDNSGNAWVPSLNCNIEELLELVEKE